MELKSSIIINAEVFPVLMSTKYQCLSSIGSCDNFIRTIVGIETNDKIRKSKKNNYKATKYSD